MEGQGRGQAAGIHVWQGGERVEGRGRDEKAGTEGYIELAKLNKGGLL